MLKERENYMPEYRDTEAALYNQISAIITRRESGEERPEAEQGLLRTFASLIAEIFYFTEAYHKGGLIEQGQRTVTDRDISLKQKDLWMLCLQINDASAKNKIVECMRALHPQLATMELEVR